MIASRFGSQLLTDTMSRPFSSQARPSSAVVGISAALCLRMSHLLEGLVVRGEGVQQSEANRGVACTAGLVQVRYQNVSDEYMVPHQ
ncbi:hypothetical protein BDW71DRAFT_184762 [Aspergillus fruticulosus]